MLTLNVDVGKLAASLGQREQVMVVPLIRLKFISQDFLAEISSCAEPLREWNACMCVQLVSAMRVHHHHRQRASRRITRAMIITMYVL